MDKLTATLVAQPLDILEGLPTTDELNLSQLTVAGLAQRCAQETERFFQRQKCDPRFGFELFRRALEDRNEQAWECIYTQYSPLVTGWVHKHSMFAATGEAPAYFANRAFEKLWVSLPAERFGNFPDLKAILRYLQMCVNSVIVDYVRAAQWAEPEEEADSQATAGPDVQDQALDRVQREELWRWLNVHLHDARERAVVYGSFVLDLKPRELYSCYPQRFSSVAEIYCVKQNVLARLRRDPEFEQYLRE